jgi:hypothetical protein
MSVTPVTLQIAGSVNAAASVPQPLYCLVCDMRSASSRALAAEGERLAIRIARTNGDITDLWFDDLSQRWKAGPLAIAGLTEHGPLFCLERFAWDHGLRVMFRGTHRALDGGYVEHAITGPFPTIAAAHTELAGVDWPTRLARLLRSCPSARDTSTTTVRGVRAGRGEGALVSWVIAPKVVRS